MIQFVKNYEDLSTDRGYQFKFYCDKCGNGHMSEFDASVVGMAGSVLRAAGSIFGGWMGSAGNSSYEIQRMVGGPAHDAALKKAVEQGRLHFHQCTRCGRWVCPDVCWNAKANMCEECAPDFHEQMVAAQAQAKVQAMQQQMYERAQQYNYAQGVDMSPDAYQQAAPVPVPPPSPGCSKCGANLGTAKFCPECGTPAPKPAPAACPQCQVAVSGTPKFCPECGFKF